MIKEVRVFSRITEKENVFLTNHSYSNIDIELSSDAKRLVRNLKSIYEDYWKKTKSNKYLNKIINKY